MVGELKMGNEAVDKQAMQTRLAYMKQFCDDTGERDYHLEQAFQYLDRNFFATKEEFSTAFINMINVFAQTRVLVPASPVLREQSEQNLSFDCQRGGAAMIDLADSSNRLVIPAFTSLTSFTQWATISKSQRDILYSVSRKAVNAAEVDDIRPIPLGVKEIAKISFLQSQGAVVIDPGETHNFCVGAITTQAILFGQIYTSDVAFINSEVQSEIMRVFASLPPEFRDNISEFSLVPGLLAGMCTELALYLYLDKSVTVMVVEQIENKIRQSEQIMSKIAGISLLPVSN